MPVPTRPTVSPTTRRGLRARIGRAKRRAALVTSAGLLAVGGTYAFAPDVDDAGLGTPAVAEAPPSTLLPPPVVPVSDVRAQDPAEGSGGAIPGGAASYYGAELAGNPTANGERFDPSDLTAAHRTLPFGTRVRVTHARTGESVVVRINDRGPFHGDRVIDLSKAAADAIGLTRSGTADVALERIGGVRG